ncbi:MAG: hypothetical protein WC058_07910 [Phycisphaeraceae bacterium]
MIRNTHDDGGQPPALRCYLNMGTLAELPDFSTGPRPDDAELYHAIKAAGYQGVQGGDAKPARAAGLGAAGGGRVNEPDEAATTAKQNIDAGFECATLHVGWGMEDDDQMDRLVDAVLDASAKFDFPMFIETHRATITQDNWRTVKLVERRPDVRFNGDFSHWYTGHEMVYGGFGKKLAFITPVLERVRFIHGRIGNPGCMQVAVGVRDDEPNVEHFKAMWIASMRGFLRTAEMGDYLTFAPELLYAKNAYARTFPGAGGVLTEESDRWSQALKYCDIARACFASAKTNIH